MLNPSPKPEIERTKIEKATKKRLLQIINIQSWGWKNRLILFLSIFGGTWLVLEPLFAFTAGTGVLSSIGVWGYIALVLFGATITISKESYERRKLIATISFIRFEIILTKSGLRIPVEAPQDMAVDEFVRLFLREFCSKHVSIDNTMLSLYHNNLLVNRNGKYEEVPNDLTLQEAGVSDGAVCKIRGYIRLEYILMLRQITYLPYSPSFDRDVAITLKDAVSKGLIEGDRASRIESMTSDKAYLQQVFVIDNSDETD